MLRDLLYLVLIPMAACYYTWGMYLACMSLVRAKDTLTLQTKILAYPMLIVGVTADFLLNATVGSALFLELPQYQKHEWLLTGRVSRWNDDPGRRGAIANWICHYWLDPFGINGHHCH